METLDSLDELKFTLHMMKSKGINNVRGANFVSLELRKDQKDIINEMINGATDRCFLCGSSSHFIKDCFNKKSSSYNFTENKENIKSSKKVYKKQKSRAKKVNNNLSCYRCWLEWTLIKRLLC